MNLPWTKHAVTTLAVSAVMPWGKPQVVLAPRRLLHKMLPPKLLLKKLVELLLRLLKEK
jgi:hypothetical protein